MRVLALIVGLLIIWSIWCGIKGLLEEMGLMKKRKDSKDAQTPTYTPTYTPPAPAQQLVPPSPPASAPATGLLSGAGSIEEWCAKGSQDARVRRYLQEKIIADAGDALCAALCESVRIELENSTTNVGRIDERRCVEIKQDGIFIRMSHAQWSDFKFTSYGVGDVTDSKKRLALLVALLMYAYPKMKDALPKQNVTKFGGGIDSDDWGRRFISLYIDYMINKWREL